MNLGPGARTRILLGLGLLVACGPLPVSQTVLHARNEHQAIEKDELASDAPQLVALGDRWLEAAESDRDDQNGATLKAEVALATYERARIQARHVNAKRRLNQATTEFAELAERLESLRERQRLLKQAAEAIELRVKVLQDAQPLGPIHAASPKREASRRASAKVFAERARLLCLAAKLLQQSKTPINPNAKTENPSTPANKTSDAQTSQRPTDVVLSDLDALEEQLGRALRPTPIDQAISLRSECLTQFTRLRYEQSTPGSAASDQLFQGLVATFKESPPFRDERGFVVELPGAFDTSGALKQSVMPSLNKARTVLENNPRIRLMVLARSTRASKRTQANNVQSLRNTLTPKGSVAPIIHGTRQRLHSPVRTVKGSKSKADRLELAFLPPS